MRYFSCWHDKMLERSNGREGKREEGEREGGKEGRLILFKM